MKKSVCFANIPWINYGKKVKVPIESSEGASDVVAG